MADRLSYREIRFWSPFLGANAARLSMADQRGQEYFAILSTEGRDWRDRRDHVLGGIVWAMQRGDPPGEVSGQ